MRALWVAVATCALLAPRIAYADRSVSGTVIDNATGKPVTGALVMVGTQEATTDVNGLFVVEDAPFGRLDVLVSADGFGTFFGSSRVGEPLAIKLDADAKGSELVRVSGRVPSGPALHLDTQQIRNQPGAGNDALRALQSLPGVARTPFGLGGLALRGTAPRDTKVYLDGIEVPLLYHFGGLASFLPTGAVDELTLEPGGASVRFGRGLGGVAVVTSRTGRNDDWHTGAEVSLIHAAVLSEGPGPLKGSWLIGARRSYFDAIQAATGLQGDIAPRYGDAQLRWESGDGRWMAILFGSEDRLELVHDPNAGDSGGINTASVKSFSYTSRFARTGLRYRAVKGSTQFTTLISAGVDDVNGRANHNDTDKGMHRRTFPLSLRSDVATPLAGGTFSAGIDGGASHHWYSMLNTPPPFPGNPSPDQALYRSLTRWTADVGAWVEQSWFFLGDHLEVRPGLRGDHFGLSDQWTLDPRLAVHENLPNGVTLTQSVGIYHEPPLITDLDPIFMRTTPMLGSKATQVAVGAKTIIGDDKEVSVTGYYQDLQQLPVDAISAATPISANGSEDAGGFLAIARDLVDSEFGSYSYREAIGKGRAYGVELIARKNVGAFTGWIAYTYSRSVRQNPIHGSEWYPYVLDQPHQFTLLGTREFGRNWRFGGRVRYATGNPYTPVASSFQDTDGDWVAVDGPLLSQRLPSFFQVDLRLDRVWRRPYGMFDLYIDVQNVTNRRNPEGVTYNEDYTRRSYTNGLPVFPSIGVEFIPK